MWGGGAGGGWSSVRSWRGQWTSPIAAATGAHSGAVTAAFTRFSMCLAVPRRPAFGQIKFERPQSQHVGFVRAGTNTTTTEGLESGEQLAERKWFDEVVVSAVL